MASSDIAEFRLGLVIVDATGKKESSGEAVAVDILSRA